MAEITVDFDVVCDKCGADLDADAKISGGVFGGWKVKVEPCSMCMQEARDDSFESGKEHGEADAKASMEE